MIAFAPTEVLDLALDDFGVLANIAGTPVKVLLSLAPEVADPYTSDLISDAPRPWVAVARAADIDGTGLYSLAGESVDIDGQWFRVLRFETRNAETRIYLRREE